MDGKQTAAVDFTLWGLQKPKVMLCSMQSKLARLPVAIMVQSSEFAAITTRVLTDNTAQSVLIHLRGLEDNRAHVRTRWVWELLQNARDAAVKSEGKLVASITQNEKEIVFRHNGDNFKMEEIAHLIYHGSTKVENEETIGQYGSGFLTTHLLSPEIEVSGRLEDGRSFCFPLKRKLGSVSELSASMKNAGEAFVSSLSSVADTDDFPTKFRYPLRVNVLDVVSEGIAKLKQCAPLIVAFNSQFATIDIATPSGVVVFDVVDRKKLQQAGIEQIAVSETVAGNKRIIQYLVAHGNKVSVAVPVETTDSGQGCRQIEDTPRLFLGFPLIGTENFSFPAIINSFRFGPTTERDGVYLWQSESNANEGNQAVLAEACDLLVGMLQFAADSGWSNAYRLAEIPNLQPQKWLGEVKFRDFLKESLIARIRQTPAVRNEAGNAIPPKESEIPLADTPAGVVGLWDLLVEWQEDGDIWPRRDEAAGWCDAVKSWAKLSQCEPLTFEETIDGRKLASIVDSVSHDPQADPRTHRVSLLADSLKGNQPAIAWLDRLIGFLRANGQGDAVSEHHIVPSQEGFLRALPNLHRDAGISEELKAVAGLLEWRIKPQLRDTRITSLEKEPGAGDWDNDYIIGELIKKLRERADKNPDAAFAEASVRLFSWIAERENWELLRGFPVFARGDASRPTTVISLQRNDQTVDRPLAPVQVWPADLRPFADLFPPGRILADDFFKSSPETEVWQRLAEQNFVRKEVVLSNDVHFGKFYPDHPLREGVEHSTVAPVSITDLWRRADIMERVRDSQARARLFWRFLTEWLSPKDIGGLEIKEAQCLCGEEHRYYAAAWIEPLRESAWIRQGNDARTYATAQSLASLLRGSDAWNPNALEESSVAGKLLAAMGVSRLDLVRELVAGDEASRAAVDNAFIDMLATSRGDTGRLSQAHQYLKALETDPGLPQVVEEHLKRRQRVHENQCLGEVVESLVQESLQEAGFKVSRTGYGSDFKIEPAATETDDVASLELERSGQIWLVEVKSTRERAVRMTAKQAETAVDQGDGFLLCVVPVEGDPSALDLDDVRDAMRFVANIGPDLAPLWASLNQFNLLKSEITTEDPAGIQLAFDSGGTARFRVTSPVWETKGISLSWLLTTLNSGR